MPVSAALCALKKCPDQVGVMQKDHIQRVNDWNELKKRFILLCNNNRKLDELLKKQLVYHSGDIEDDKKSTLALAFTEVPINTYRTDNGGISVETQWGCRLFYVLEYNGTISCYIKGYDEVNYKLTTYSSAKKIEQRQFNRNVASFLIVEKNTSKTALPTGVEQAKYLLLKTIGQKNMFEIIAFLFSKIPFLKSMIKAIPKQE